ncbi:MAG TPA: ferric reductase-like transmembrane domain-containing protein [Candidatus Saccharimonadales bacterium]|nr:ferric reductase-like transmembrane domain-containing protein [Candidatus Saccharimonadales bacterium]
MQPAGDRPVIISFRIEHLLGWAVTFGLCLVPVVLWLQIHPLNTVTGFVGIMLALGRVTGLIGMVMYALNLVYATRLRFLEFWFGGLNRVYIAHHLLGGFALIFLTFHPLFLALRYVHTSLMQAALLLLPNGLGPLGALFNRHAELHQVVLNQWALFFGIIAFWGMVGLLLITFFVKVAYRFWLMTHKWLGVVFFIGGLHVLFISSDTSTDMALKTYILGITVVGLAAYVYRTLANRLVVKLHRYSVTQVVTAGGNVSQITLYPSDRPMRYRPGQFVFVRFLGAEKVGVSDEWHPFSISSAPHETTLEISVKALGDYTNKLGRLPNGTIAEIEGAYGRFSFNYFKNHNQVWIAGGIGVTPFISMARSLPPDNSYHVDLYYSIKTATEVIDWTALAIAANQHGGTLRVFPYIGDQMPGHLTTDYIEQYSGDLRGKDFFLCGPPPMMQSLRKQLRAKQVPGTSIHSEEFAMS